MERTFFHLGEKVSLPPSILMHFVHVRRTYNLKVNTLQDFAICSEAVWKMSHHKAHAFLIDVNAAVRHLVWCGSSLCGVDFSQRFKISVVWI